MVLIGWSDGEKTLLPDAEVPAWLSCEQNAPGFIMQGAESIEGYLRIQHTSPEWHLVRLVLWRWDFKIQGNTWTILKHVNGFRDGWQTHWDFLQHLTGPAVCVVHLKKCEWNA